MKLGEQIKQFKCRVAQGFNQLGVTFFLVKAAISPQFSLTPVKLPTKRCPFCKVRPRMTEGWYFTCRLLPN